MDHDVGDDPSSGPFLIQVTAGETAEADLLLNDFDPPPNDLCENPIPVALDQIPFSDTQLTRGATMAEAEVASECAILEEGRSVWYSLTNDSGSEVEIFLKTDDSDYDTLLQVFRGTCQAPVSEVCNDDVSFFDLTSRVTFPAQPGETFLFKVTGFFETGGELVFNLDLIEEPENDDCQDAIQLGRSDLPFMDMIDTREASNEPLEPETTCGDPDLPEQSHSVYYSFTNDFSLPVEIELSTAGSDYDTVVQVYTGTCQGPVPEVCNDDVFPGLTSRLTFLAQPRESYLVKVSSWNASPGGHLSFSARALGAVKSEDMELVLASLEAGVSARGNLTYAVAVYNLGLNTLTGVEVTATLPEQTTLVAAGNKGVLCDQSSLTFTCQVGSLSAGGEISFPVTVSPQVAGQTSVHGEVDWDQRTLDIPSSTLVRKVDPFLTLPTSFPVQNGQAMAANQQGSGAPFVGAAVVNLTDEENRLILEGFDSQGDLTFLNEDAALLPPSSQIAFIVEDLPGLPTTTSTLLARSDKRGLVGFFMQGNSPIDRLDGIGRLLPEAKKLYLPLARSGAGGRTSHLDFFNPYPDRNDVDRPFSTGPVS